MSFVNRLRLVLDPGNLAFFLRSRRIFRSDSRYSTRNLIRALWHVSKDEKIVRHEKQFVHSSFLPPIPSRAAYQVLEAVAGEDSVFGDHVSARRRAPISMYVAVTGRCSFNCRHCCAAGREEAGEWETNDLLELFSDIQAMGTAIIGLTGGEPLLREDLAELIAAIDDRSVSFLFTSGHGLSSERAQELKRAGLFAIGVSLDSASAATMDDERGVPGAFAAAVEAVRYGRQAGLYTMTQTVASRHKLQSGSLEDIVQLSSELGAHEVRVLESMPVGRLEHTPLDEVLTAADRRELRRFHVRMNRSWRGPKVSVFAHTEDHSNYGCGAGTQHSYIDAAGNLCPCDFVPLSFGSVREQSVAELWHGMHEIIRQPRRQCMAMELHADQLLEKRTSLPLSPEDSRHCVGQLEKSGDLPDFYMRLAGKT